jgi:nucleoside-triphosphatase
MASPLPPKIFLTGLPGCGKTTIIKAVKDRLAEFVTGFYTEEVRDEFGRRIGFDLVSHEGARAVLAREGEKSRTRVGKYSVFVEPLEEWGLDLLKPSSQRPLVILDEVGKMECLSKAFQQRVTELIRSSCPILGSVAIRGGGLVGRVHEDPAVECREVNSENRNGMVLELESEYHAYLVAAGWGLTPDP